MLETSIFYIDNSWLAALLSDEKIELDSSGCQSPKAGQPAMVWLKTCAADYIKASFAAAYIKISMHYFREMQKEKRKRDTF